MLGTGGSSSQIRLFVLPKINFVAYGVVSGLQADSDIPDGREFRTWQLIWLSMLNERSPQRA